MSPVTESPFCFNHISLDDSGEYCGEVDGGLKASEPDRAVGKKQAEEGRAIRRGGAGGVPAFYRPAIARGTVAAAFFRPLRCKVEGVSTFTRRMLNPGIH